MRLLIFFDLPMLTEINRREYTIFRRYLLKNGYIMMQKSVYTKLSINSTCIASYKADIRRNLPSDGLVEMLEVTEKQFNQIEYLCGKKQSKVIDSDERLVIL